MQSPFTKSNLFRWIGLPCASLSLIAMPLLFAQQPAPKPAAKAPPRAAAPTPAARLFDSPQQATDALVAAAESFDVSALTQIFGPGAADIVLSGEFAQDRKHAADFVAQARVKKSVSVEPKNGARAFLLVGEDDWPFPRAAREERREVVFRRQCRPPGASVPPHRR